jgi:hypothetical protein
MDWRIVVVVDAVVEIVADEELWEDDTYNKPVCSESYEQYMQDMSNLQGGILVHH